MPALFFPGENAICKLFSYRAGGLLFCPTFVLNCQLKTPARTTSMLKKIAVTALFFLALCVRPAAAQVNYSSAIGARLGVPAALSYKYFVSDAQAVELYGSWVSRRFSWGGFSVVGLGGTFQIHKDLSLVTDGLTWFFGGGGDVSLFSSSDDYFRDNYSGLGLAIHGALGLDYGFDDIPVDISIDWIPTLNLTGGYYSGFTGGYGALAVRYILGR